MCGSWLRRGNVRDIQVYQSFLLQLYSSLEIILNKDCDSKQVVYMSLHTWCSKECPRSLQYTNLCICTLPSTQQYESSAWTVTMIVTPREVLERDSDAPQYPGVNKRNIGLVWRRNILLWTTDFDCFTCLLLCCTTSSWQLLWNLHHISQPLN